MSALRRRVVLVSAVSLAAGLVAGTGYAQSQPEVSTARVYCVKVAPGKALEYEAFLRDVTVPLNQSRADAGEFEWFGAERAVAPAGSSARCDYLLAYTYKGMPPEEMTNDQLGAALKRAAMSLTAPQLLEKRTSLIQLVGVEYWGNADAAGPRWTKGSYLRFNLHKVKDGQWDEYLRLERTWKALVEAWVKAGGKGSWLIAGLGMPGGVTQPFNAATVDVFPDWGGLMQGVPSDQLWPKVHPNLPFTDVEAQKDKVRSPYAFEVYRLVESVERKAAR